MGRFITLWATFQSMWQQLFCPNCLHIFGNFCKFVKIFHSTSKILFGRLLWIFGNFSQVTLKGRYIWSRICLERLPGASVTRYWNIKKPDCFRKLSKSIFLNEPKNLNSFWATFLRKFVTQNFQKSPNLVTLSSKKLEYSDWLIIVMGVFLTNQSSLFWRSIGKLLLNLLMTLTPGVKSLTSEFREKYTNSREDLKDKYLHQNRSLNMSTLK